MKTQKQVLRTCVVSHETCEKRDLIRVVRTPEGNVIVDLKGKANGRGAYLKKSRDVVLKAKSTKALDKKLEVSVPDEIYDQLMGIVDGE